MSCKPTYKGKRYNSIQEIYNELGINNCSKIVDENGEPLVVYHGSPNDNINIFKHHPDKAQKVGGRGTGTEGFYFTPKKEYAKKYKAEHLMRNPDTSKGKIYEVFLNIRNLGTFDTNNTKLENVDISSFYNMQENDRAFFESLGYDGLQLGNILNNRNNKRPEIVVFDNNQIKSATDNIGTFDVKNPDIRYAQTELITAAEIYAKPISQGSTDNAFGVRVVNNINEFVNNFPIQYRASIKQILADNELNYTCQ